MSLLTRLFGTPKKEIEELGTEPGNKKSQSKPETTGTTLRPPVDATRITQKKPAPELSALELADQQGWQVKTLPVWQPGDVILGTYEVEDVISGGMGHVYIANHKNWNVKLAVKSPNEMMLSDRDFFARILREANSWTELGLHPNIAYCYYVRNIEDVPHIFVEYVDGGNLRQWIEEGRCIDYRTSLDLAIQFCHGMEHAHSKGMIHRDIKPENVLMTKDGVLKITDFGLVREQGTGSGGPISRVGSEKETRKPVEHGLTTVGTVMGTEGYMAPEQAESASDVDERADIFSFGVCLFEMFCGNKPYDITYGPKHEPPDPVMLSGDDNFPGDIGTILSKCVRWKQKERYSNVKEVRQGLLKIYKDLFGKESPYAELEVLELEADGLNNQGVAYFELDKVEQAIESWEKALKISQTHLEATYNSSLIQWRAGKIDDLVVLAHLDNCSNNPSADNERLSELKAYIHAERFHPDGAQDMLKNIPGRYEDLFSGKDMGLIKGLHTMEGHTIAVNDCSLTPDGRYAVSGSSDTTVRVWDLETGQGLHTLEGHNFRVLVVSVTPDGRHAISGGDDKTLRMWKIETGQCVRIMKGHTDMVRSITVTPDGRYAVSASQDMTLGMWELETGRCVHTMRGHTKYVSSIALTPDGRYVVSGSGDTTLRMWELETGRCVHTMRGHTKYVSSVTVTPDGRNAISESGDKIPRMWNLETGRCVRTIEGHNFCILCLAVTPDGRHAVSMGDDQTLRIWELETGQCVRTMEGHTYTAKSVTVTPDGRYALFGNDDQTLRMWNLETGQCLRTMEVTTGRLTMTPDGRYAVSGGNDNTLLSWKFMTAKPYKAEPMVSLPKRFDQRKKEEETLDEVIRKAEQLYKIGDHKQSFAILYKAWEGNGFSDKDLINCLYSKLMEKGKVKGLIFFFPKKIFRGHADRITTVTLASDGQYAISGSADNTLRMWNLETGQCVHTMEGHTGAVHGALFTPDGRYAVSGSSDKTLRIWDLYSGQSVRTMKGHTGSVYHVLLTPDGRYAISSCNDNDDKTLKMWDLETGQCARTLEGHTGRIISAAITTDGRYAISGSWDKTLRMWDLETGQCVRTLTGHSEPVRSFALTPDGNHVISGSLDQTLRMWDLETGRCIHTMEGHMKYVLSVAVTPDGRYAVSGSGDKTLRIWDLESGQCVRTMKGHTEPAKSCTLTQDGKYAISGGRDKALRLWDLKTGQCLCTMEGHTHEIESISITADGRYALSGSNDKTIRVWNFIWDLEFD